ncbi:hypothetical protein C8R44DRAFT_983314 [Mycena epipterygia]|nr:hypothetical protein C8R44DRAFT_983314 [Mycena epipterygia]
MAPDSSFHCRPLRRPAFQDLYDLVRPSPHTTVASAVPSHPGVSTSAGPSSSSTIASPAASASGPSTSSAQTHAAKQPATSTDAASDTALHQPLLPASNPVPEQGVLRRVSPDVIPFWAQHKAEVEGQKSQQDEGVDWADPLARIAQQEEY